MNEFIERLGWVLVHSLWQFALVALLAIEELRGRSTVLALGAADGSLLSRVRRIVGSNVDQASVPFGSGWLACLLTLGLVLIIGFGTFVSTRAESENDPKESRKTEGDLRSNPAAGSGDPRRAPVKVESPVADDRQARSEEVFARKASLDVKDLPLSQALGRLIDWNLYPGVFRELRGGALSLSTIEAMQERTAKALPDWLKPVYGHGLLAKLDDDNQVFSITAGDGLTDELLARLHTLPKHLGLNS
ncbi:MAG: hypothetical protein ACKV2Q_06315 [Planctomycetaceae bacterium]